MTPERWYIDRYFNELHDVEISGQSYSNEPNTFSLFLLEIDVFRIFGLVSAQNWPGSSVKCHIINYIIYLKLGILSANQIIIVMPI